MASLPAAGMESFGEHLGRHGHGSSKIIEAFSLAEINYSNSIINNIMIIDIDISIVNVIITIVCNTMNIDNISSINITTRIRITTNVIMYVITAMNISMNSIVISISSIIGNMVVTINNTISHTDIGISLIINTISIDTINNKLTSAHGVVIDLIIAINVLLLLGDMNDDIINMCIITNIISIVGSCMHISDTDCKCYHSVSYDKILYYTLYAIDVYNCIYKYIYIYIYIYTYMDTSC